MPGIRCSVAMCNTNFEKSRQLGEKVSFFSFPKDKELSNEWVRRCYRMDKFYPKHKRICHKHFKEDDFEDSMEAKLMNRPTRRLKNCAIPSLLLRENEQVILSTARANRLLKKEQEIIAEVLPNASEIEKDEKYLPLELDLNLSTSQEESTSYTELLRKYNNLAEENGKLKKKIAEDAISTNILQHKVVELEAVIQQQNIALKKRREMFLATF